MSKYDGYMPPIIEMVYQNHIEEINRAVEGEIMKAVATVGVSVDKDRLLKAVTDAREFYSEGYANGKADAMAELVHCKDCKHAYLGDCRDYDDMAYCQKIEEGTSILMPMDAFCSYGERKENADVADS